jgi:hypothetical protein
MFKMSPASLQTFIDTPNCVLEDRVRYSTVHIPNVLCDGHTLSFSSHPREEYRAEKDPEILEATRLTLTPSGVPNSNYVIMVGD